MTSFHRTVVLALLFAYSDQAGWGRGPELGSLAGLSGEWGGTTQTLQMGSCRLERASDLGGLDARMESASDLSGLDAPGRRVVIDPVTLSLRFEASGDFTMEERANGTNSPIRWTGHIAKDGTVRATRQMEIHCTGENRTAEFHYSGRLELKKKGPRMRLGGVEEWCPRDNCKFQMSLNVSKNAGSSPAGSE